MRDLALAESHAAAIDDAGNLLQWGSSFSPLTHTPQVTLANKDLVQVGCTHDKVYALSRGGKVYCLSACGEASVAGSVKATTENTGGWWRWFSGGGSGDNGNAVELALPTSMGWGER